MKDFDSLLIAEWNRLHSAQFRFEAIALHLDVADIRRFAKVQHPVVIDGFTYDPLGISFSGIQQSVDMPVLAVQVNVNDVAGMVTSFLETTDIRGCRIDIMIMQMGLLDIATARMTLRLQVMLPSYKPWEGASITCGIDLALSEQIPGDIITRALYPGVPDLLRRASIL